MGREMAHCDGDLVDIHRNRNELLERRFGADCSSPYFCGGYCYHEPALSDRWSEVFKKIKIPPIFIKSKNQP